jgi:hypothetical protein
VGLSDAAQEEDFEKSEKRIDTVLVYVIESHDITVMKDLVGCK